MAGAHPAYLWLNGERTRWEDGTIHVSELGWSTIGAVFEGIRAYWNADEGELYVFRLQEHLERLARSMKLVRLPLHYSLDELAAATHNLLRANDAHEDTYIFPMAYTANSYTSRYDRPDAQSAIQILTRPLPSHLGTGLKLKARISSWRRISEDVMPPRVKNLSNYRNGQLARMEATLDGYDTSLIINNQGKISEAPGACVMVVRDGTLTTPDLTSGILESITRDALITLAREELGIRVEERMVDRTELYVADEVFLCGTAAEISPVVSVDKYDVADGEPGPVTRELEALFDRVLRGRESRYRQWRSAVGVREAVAV
ncbi:MAG TPA: branched-chain amino acid transaminase [Thermomicrobiales bacterium]|nr:branched-chain amino acid transaminase [Thermomicrobiales bacterium]